MPVFRMMRDLVIGVAALAASAVAAQAPTPPTATASAASTTAAESAVDQAPASATLDAGDIEAWLDGFMPYALARGEVAGAVVVVVNRDGPVFEKGYGYADVASRKPVLADATLFRPGSVSKLATWTAVMQLVEAGKLDLDADINSYIDFKIPAVGGKAVTLRHVMTHTGGFEESIRYLITNDPKAMMPLGELVKKALPAQVFAPGTMPAYSNYATALAGHVVERASGMSFDDYVEKRIFAPLGMTRSSFRQPLPAALQPLMSSGYATSRQKAKPFEFVLPAPAGSQSSTGADMGRFMIAHLNEGGALMRPETARMMHDFKAPGVGPLNSMALGFYEQWVNGRRAIAHGGDTTLFHSYLWLFPQDGLGLYISMNSSGKEGAPGAIRSALFHGFADRYLPGEDGDGVVVDVATAREHAAMLAGRYVSSRGAFTNFMSVLGLVGQLEVVVGPEGEVMLPGLDGLTAGARDWVEVSDFVWRDRATGERLAAEVEGGRVVRLSMDAISPFMVLVPAPAATNAGWLLPAFGAALALILLAAVFWPVRALVRRQFKTPFALSGASLRAWRLSRVFAVLVIVAVVGWAGFVAAFSSDIGSVGGPLDWLIISLRILTPVAAVGLLLTAGWLLLRTLKDGRQWTMKLGALLLTLSGAVLCWVVYSFNLYGFGMVY